MIRLTTYARCVLIFALSLSANADPIDVSYDIGPYSSGGYSASWLHTASGCEGTGPSSGDTLYMCGWATAVTGSVSGSLDGGIFTVDAGYLNIFGNTFDILSGSLGGDFSNANDDLLWFLQIAGFGTFYFEGIDMGTGGPNYFGADEFILWGQNTDAYGCAEPSLSDNETYECMPWGIDLYGKQVSVPEPGTAALLSLGLIALAVTRRRRLRAQSRF